MALPSLSVLDQSPVRSGGTTTDAIHETLELAALADRLGYRRYWLAEHHSTAALASPYTARDLAIIEGARRRSIAGDPSQVRERLLALAAEYEADEIVVVTITHSFKARMRSYELLAEAFDLEGGLG